MDCCQGPGIASFVVGPRPMDLAFPPGLVLTVLLAVLITGQVQGMAVRLARGGAASCRLPDPRHHVLFPAEWFATRIAIYKNRRSHFTTALLSY